MRKAVDEIVIFLRECGARKESGGKREIHSSNKKVVFECLSTHRLQVIHGGTKLKLATSVTLYWIFSSIIND